MSSRPELLVAPCSYQAAKYAVVRWHYSKRMPCGKLAKFGVWERGKFLGAILFGRGAIYHIGAPWGLDQTEVCELVRVALDAHETPLSRILHIAFRLLKRACPGLRLVVSYADSAQGHLGTAYQAAGLVYVGQAGAPLTRVLGIVTHPRTLGMRYRTQRLCWLRKHVDPDAALVPTLPKFKYVWPLDKAMRRVIERQAKPYPKRLPDRGTPAPTGDGGANPTQPLQNIQGASKSAPCEP